jgi:biotin carboxylase
MVLPGNPGRLLLLGMGRMGRQYVDRAHRRGMRCAVADYPGRLTAEAVDRVVTTADDLYPVTSRGDEAWYAAAGAAAARGPIDAVIGFGDSQIVAAAMIAEELGLPGVGTHAAVVSRNKLFQRELLTRHAVPQPAYRCTDDVEDACRWAAGRYPVVVKPLSGSGSIGVRIVGDDADLRDWAGEPPGNRRFLVEECLTGSEFSCEALVRNGKVLFASVTEKHVTAPPYCVELAHVVPAGCAPAEQRVIQGIARRVVDAGRLRDGLLHLEVKTGRTGVQVVEFAVRTPGDLIVDLVLLATGVDLYDAAVAVAAGLDVEVRPRDLGAACAWFPVAPPGLVSAVTGLDRLRRCAGVLMVDLPLHPGTTIGPVRDSGDRLGFAVLHAPDRAALRERLTEAQATLHISVDPADAATTTEGTTL